MTDALDGLLVFVDFGNFLCEKRIALLAELEDLGSLSAPSCRDIW